MKVGSDLLQNLLNLWNSLKKVSRNNELIPGEALLTLAERPKGVVKTVFESSIGFSPRPSSSTPELMDQNGIKISHRPQL